MSHPIVSLAKFKHVASLSEETTCFTATVLFDGVPVMVASNRGQGGGTDLDSLPKEPRSAIAPHVQTLIGIAEANPTKYTFDFEKAEQVIDRLVYAELTKKTLVRRMKTRTLLTQKGKKGIFEIKREWIKEDRSRLPTADIIFNELPIDEAVEKYIDIENEQAGI